MHNSSLIKLRNGWQFGYCIIKHFNDTACSYRAAALTLTTLLALVPLMTTGLAIFAIFPQFAVFSERIQDFIFSNFLFASGRVIQTYLQSFVTQAAKLSAVGLSFLLVTSLLMMFTLEGTLNAIWRVQKSRHWFTALLLYWSVLTLSPILMGAGLAITSYLAASSVKLSQLIQSGLAIAPFLLSVLVFSLLYIAVPNCFVPVRYGLVGALIAAILFEVLKYFFALYIKYFPTYKILYGALAIIPLFLVWLYLCWLITLFGAVVSNVLAEKRSARTS